MLPGNPRNKEEADKKYCLIGPFRGLIRPDIHQLVKDQFTSGSSATDTLAFRPVHGQFGTRPHLIA